MTKKTKNLAVLLFTVTAALCMAFAFTACNTSGSTTSEGLEYTLSADGTSYTVSGIGTCTDKKVVIPSTYNELPVTEIGEQAFNACTKITSITIPDSVTAIDRNAFLSCDRLTSISIPDSVTTIGSGAFQYCGSLNYNSYENGYYLGNDSNEYVVLVDVTDRSVSEFTINSHTKVIYSSAFYQCESLESITLPDGVTSIGEFTFNYCYSLTSITIPNSVTTIGNGAFSSCESLESITLPDSITTIGDYTFKYCYSLTSITIPASVTTIGFEAFYNCNSLESVTFENTSGWYVSNIIGATSGTDVDVTDAGANVTYLVVTYIKYDWYRN